MFNQISWGQFLLALAILIVVYYGVMALSYLKKPGKGNDQPPDQRGKRVWQVETVPDAESPELASPNADAVEDVFQEDENWTEQLTSNESEEAFNSLEKLAQSIEAILGEPMKENNAVVLMGRLQAEIRKHPLLKAQAFKTAIANLIVRRVSFPVTKEEVFALWD